MARYIELDALVAEIDRQIHLLKPFLDACAGQIVAEANNKLSVLEGLKNFLGTLEVKEVNLEKEIDKWYDNEASKEFENVLYKDIEKCAKHFFELGMNTSKGKQ